MKFNGEKTLLVMSLNELLAESICKVVIYKYVFCWLYSVPNLIVISFNMLYPVFIVGFNCKGCVIKREDVKTQVIEDKRVFVGSS